MKRWLRDFLSSSPLKVSVDAAWWVRIQREGLRFEKEIRVFFALYLVHSDVFGPIPTTSMNVSRYFMTFIDDYSRYCWIYFLNEKSKAFETFKIFKVLAENNLGKKIKALRLDNGGEYIKREFQQLCASTSIQMQHSIPYNPQKMV